MPAPAKPFTASFITECTKGSTRSPWVAACWPYAITWAWACSCESPSARLACRLACSSPLDRAGWLAWPTACVANDTMPSIGEATVPSTARAEAPSVCTKLESRTDCMKPGPAGAAAVGGFSA